MIKKATFKNFQAFNSFTVDEFSPINVIIGGNDSGKTSLLKILYTITKSFEEFALKSKHAHEPFKKVLSNKVINTFNCKNKIGRIVKRGANDKLMAEVTYCNRQNVHFTFTEHAKENITDCTEHVEALAESNNALFIPAKEVLSIFKSIEATRANLFIPEFDDTYYDLVKALKIPTQRGKVETNLVNVNKTLEEVFEGEIQQKRGDVDIEYVFKKGKHEYPMSLTAEGVKKIGILTTLIRNRNLHKDTMLFMDEPDTNLHPDAIRRICEITYNLSKAGVQVFLSTHNYFMIKQFSIIARREKCKMNCISLYKEDDILNYRTSDLQNGMPDNSIVEEALKMFDEETDLDLA